MIIMSTIGPALKLLIIGSFLNIVVVTFSQIMFLILIINKYCPYFCRIGFVRNFTTLVLTNFKSKSYISKVDSNRNIDDVFADVMKIFGELPPKEVRKVKRKKQKIPVDAETDWVEEWETFSGQRIVFVLGTRCLCVWNISVCSERVCTWNASVCLERVLCIWNMSVHLECVCVSGTCPRVWNVSVYLERVCVSGRSLCVWKISLCLECV